MSDTIRQNERLTTGNILFSLVKFALPVLLALVIQALYGAVDLLIVGQFGETADVSGVATGSMLTTSLSDMITSLSMGVTVALGMHIGAKEPTQAGKTIGSGICLFAVAAAIMTAWLVGGADLMAWVLQAPADALNQTVTYIRICGIGFVFIVAYNLLGAIFRGLGDARTPLITVAIACVLNIGGDLLLVAVFHMGTAGAAIATVAAQGISVAIALLFIRRMKLPFHFSRKFIRFRWNIISKELKIGLPIALQDILVSSSFLVIQAVCNTFGLIDSSAVGVSEKLILFIMLVPLAYMQSMSAFVAQNIGAGKPQRAKKALLYGILTSLAVGVVMGVITLFWGNALSAIFCKDAEVITASHTYLMAYAIDCVLTPFLFCFIGYFNGREHTLLVMIQGIVGAIAVRVPLVLLIAFGLGSQNLFLIGLATPASSFTQIVICLVAFSIHNKKEKRMGSAADIV